MLKYDKRHTTKPHTEGQWREFDKLSKTLSTEHLAYKYGVTKRTIYNWRWERKLEKKLWNIAKSIG